MKKIAITAVMGILLGTSAHARKMDCEGIFPKNNAWIGIEMLDQGLDEATFNRILDKLTTIYNPIVASHGFTLSFNRQWSDGTVNSDTYTQDTTWIVDSYGGLARYNGMTADAYAAVACHELGHHLGGAPLFGDGSGMSVEGEADYHVGTKCLRKYFAGQDNVREAAALVVDPTAIAKCTADWPGDANAQAICERSAMAGLVLATVMQELSGTPAIALNTPDSSQVDQTNEDHPQAQCRLDTYFGGGLCNIPDSVEFSPSDYKVGACTAGDGIRPRCWFKPN